ncbi:MAG: VanZ family protein [Gammaproteobacteria bacterium]|nr:VanZ family protein [Gammaproteobacteria bacterium]
MAITWALTIAVLSLTPLQRLPLATPFSDKLNHFAAYALLGLLAYLARSGRAPWLLWPLLLTLYGGLIELLQPYVNRHAEWLDLAANGLGALAGVLLARRLQVMITGGST